MRIIDRLRIEFLRILIARKLGAYRSEVEVSVWDPSNNDWKFPVCAYYYDEWAACDLAESTIRRQAGFMAWQISNELG